MATPRVVVEGSSVTASQLKDLFRQIEDGSLGGYHIQGLLEHRNPFEIPMDPASQLSSWGGLSKSLFGLEIDDAKVPVRQAGFDRLIVVPRGLTLNRVIGVCREQFENFYCDYSDLDQAVTHNDRTNATTYAIWVRERVEADEELKNLSANQLKEQGVPGVTLMERLLLELKYFSETGKHLDLENVTLCSGSRCSVGHVPEVGWRVDRRELVVHWYRPDYRSGHLRARAAVA